MISSFSFAVVLPAHNSAGNICETIDELTLYFEKNELKGQVIIVENGSEDDTWEVMKSIDASNLPFELIRTHSEVGLGNAIRKGLESVTSEYVLITADDLPFGVSDIDGYKKTINYYEIINTLNESKKYTYNNNTKDIIIGKENNKLIPTNMGIKINEFMLKNFNNIIDISFSANLENFLDKIAIGKANWVNILQSFYDTFNPIIEKFPIVKKKIFYSNEKNKSIKSYNNSKKKYIKKYNKV